MSKYLVNHPSGKFNGEFRGLNFVEGKAELDTATTTHLQASVASTFEELIQKLKDSGCNVQELKGKKGAPLEPAASSTPTPEG